MYGTAGRTTGVTTSAGTTTLAYDYEGRVKTITYPSAATNTITYNGLDTRVGKVDSAGTATYRRDGADVTDPVLSDGFATYTPGISERRSGTTTEYLNDRLGSTTRQTNTSAATTGTRTYDAFGLLVATTGTPKGPFGFAGSHGYQEDADSGLKLLGHRYYDPSTGRFLTRDPIKDGRNWYGYCGSRNDGSVDASGQAPGDKFKSSRGAAKDAGKYAGPRTGSSGQEGGGYIYKNGDYCSYTYAEATPDSLGGLRFDIGNASKGPEGSTPIGTWHTHPPIQDYSGPRSYSEGNTHHDTFSGVNRGSGTQDGSGDIGLYHRYFDRYGMRLHWLIGADGVVYEYQVPVGDDGHASSPPTLGPITPIGRW